MPLPSFIILRTNGRDPKMVFPGVMREQTLRHTLLRPPKALRHDYHGNDAFLKVLKISFGLRKGIPMSLFESSLVYTC